MAIAAENLRDWQGKQVVDPHGSKIGEMEAVYYDTRNDEPSFITVITGGLFGGKRLTFVPLDGASVTPDHVRVQFLKDTVKDAPSIDTDGELKADDEPAIFEHYDLQTGPDTGTRRLARR